MFDNSKDSEVKKNDPQKKHPEHELLQVGKKTFAGPTNIPPISPQRPNIIQKMQALPEDERPVQLKPNLIQRMQKEQETVQLQADPKNKTSEAETTHDKETDAADHTAGSPIPEDAIRKITAIALAEAGVTQRLTQAKEIFWIYYNLYNRMGEKGYKRSSAFNHKENSYKIAMYHMGDATYAESMIKDYKMAGKEKVYSTVPLKEYIADPVFKRMMPEATVTAVYEYVKGQIIKPEGNPYKDFYNQGNIDDLNGDSQDIEMWHMARTYLKLQDDGKVTEKLVVRTGTGKETQFLFNLESIQAYFAQQKDKVIYKSTVKINKSNGFQFVK